LFERGFEWIVDIKDVEGDAEVMKNFALIGAAGFIAPRHMKAIQETGNQLVAALDPSDSVGIIDSFFPESAFFSEFERFDREIDKLRRAGGSEQVDYVSICSPNYLHDSHVRFALRSDADVVCEKPLVLNPWNIDGLVEAEANAGRTVNTILQLRVHPEILSLRERIQAEPLDAPKHEVDLTYITARGRWYLYSWKGDEKKSGGIATNIGVHLFDMLHYIFGALQDNRIHINTPTRASGYLEYERARVRWFLSVDLDDIPQLYREKGQRTYRSITVDGNEIEFSGGFADLHTTSYRLILEGRGFGLETNRTAIETVATIRAARPLGPTGDCHPLAAAKAG
jgi:UDP-N-acetyl-2-amino-2-deoxyglucuronate dehydrogenase